MIPKLKELWLFIGDTHKGCGSKDILSKNEFDKYLNTYMKIAHSYGWVKSIEQKFYYIYDCSFSNPCEFCDQEDMHSPGWRLERIIPTTQFREEL